MSALPVSSPASTAAQAARQILLENKTPLAALVGRYVATYNHIRKRSWWDLHLSGGTIVEQVSKLCSGPH